MKEFVFGSLIYKYNLLDQNRKTLSLTVRPDLNIIVKRPYGMDEQKVEKFLRKKWFWLEKQLSFFKKYQKKKHRKEYISGESFLYLGRQYKLSVKKSSDERVVLTKGLMVLYTENALTDGRHNKFLLNRWYNDKIRKVFNERFEEVKNNFDYDTKIKLIPREMRRRWGSYLKSGQIILNPKLIYTSKSCIDYVITHELCHLKCKNHNKNFYKLLEKKYPKWEKVKEKLEMYSI